jgi:hypothetical protein
MLCPYYIRRDVKRKEKFKKSEKVLFQSRPSYAIMLKWYLRRREKENL